MATAEPVLLPNKKMKVCVIGAGAAGLCALRHLSSKLQRFEPAAFEQTDKVGGTWVYVDKTGKDEYGNPIHSSMYKNLRTNIPNQVMNFPDYQQMDNTRPACTSHTNVLNYLNDYANHFSLNPFIQFNTKVECVRPIIDHKDWTKTTWSVEVKNLKSNTTEEKIFDAVIVCNGHNAIPRIPKIPGIETFSGEIMHSHEYRKPEVFAGKTVIALGAGPSGIDLSIEICKHAGRVYLSHNHESLSSLLSSSILQVKGIESIKGNVFTLKDGNTITADVLIYCTGYEFTFSFLHETCGITVDNKLVTPLWKHLINIEHPTMSLIGLPVTVVPFPLFHMQAEFVVALLSGNIQVPSKENMLMANKSNTARNHVLADRQWEYNNELADIAGVERLPKFYEIAYKQWQTVRMNNLLSYKDTEFVIDPISGEARITY